MEVNFHYVLLVLSLCVCVESRHLGIQAPSLAIRRHTVPSRHTFNLQQQNIGRASSVWRQPIIGIPSRRPSFRQTFNRLSGRFPQQAIRRQPYLHLRRRNPFIRISRRQYPSVPPVLTQRRISGGVRPVSYDRFSAVRSRFPAEPGILSRSYPNRQQRLSSAKSTRNTIGRRSGQQRSRLQIRPSAAHYSNILIDTQAETDDDSRSDGSIVLTNGHSDNTELLVNIRRTSEGTRVNINPPRTSDNLRNYNIYNNIPVSTSSNFGIPPSGYIVRDQQTKRQPAYAALHDARHDVRQKKRPRAVPLYTSLQTVPNEFVVEPNLRESFVPRKTQKVKPYTRAVFPADSFFYSATSGPIKITLHSKQLADRDVPDTDREATQQQSVVPIVTKENAPLHDTVSPVAKKKTAPYSKLKSVSPTDLKAETVLTVVPLKKDLKIESVPSVVPEDTNLKLESVPHVVPVEKDLMTESVPPVAPVEKDLKIESSPSVVPVKKDLKIKPMHPVVPVRKELKKESAHPVVPLEKELKIQSARPVVPLEKDLKIQSVDPVVPMKKDLTIESALPVVKLENDLKIPSALPVGPLEKDLKIESVQPVVPVGEDLKIESISPVVPVKKDHKIESVPPVVPVKKDLKIESVPPAVPVKKDLKIESVPPVVPVKKDLKKESVPPVVPVKKELKIESVSPVVPVKKDLKLKSVPSVAHR